ncbi:leucine-rich repeat domain-containing protein [Estrella lausannensis]|uniref:Disease resistance R13L4/SHOC-2-like LRR domain-containing protein n=1 Tax=Estrella lausannensis TaxID=483423 RepID=A0A0H5DU75_9BACT|nr:leucine-rich repeat domain-containing protein [Estrella lausannensis]CRX39469.1 hypothetical protein ELAC_2148 [Estrella lausannensis]
MVHSLTAPFLSLVNKGLTSIPSSIVADHSDVTEVILDGNPLGNLSTAILNFPKISSLSLNNIRMTEFPSDLGTLKHLKVLKINENNMEMLNESIGELDELEVLEVERCGLKVISPLIDRLKNLKVLKLSGNELTEIPDEICKLESLRELHLSHNLITKLPESLSSLQNLEVLNLSFNHIDTLPRAIGAMRALKRLYLTANRLWGEFPDSVGDLASLEVLAVSKNAIESLPFSMGRLEALKELRAERNQLKSLPAEITSLPHLRALSLAGNPLAKNDEVIKPGFPSLVDLALTYLLRAPTGDITQLTEDLQDDLAEPPVTCKSCKRLFFERNLYRVLTIKRLFSQNIPLLSYCCVQCNTRAKGT